MSIIPHELQRLVERVDTGLAEADISRGLVVFNSADVPSSGTAVFFAAVSWPKGTPLPTIVVSELKGRPVASVITAMAEWPDRKGRLDHRHLTFELRFAVTDVPAQGWKTYIAAYSEGAVAPPLADLPGRHRLIVVETLRHEGDLPPVGTFAEWVPSMVQ